MKVLLTGGSGQLGRALRTTLAELGDVVAPPRVEFDLGQALSLTGKLDALAPDLIVNAAAYTAVDAAETDVAAARAVNADAIAELARWAAAHDVPLVHYSTDYVFDGALCRPYRESDTPAPLNVYGATKLAGEQAVLGSGARALLLRTSWVYGPNDGNFLATMLRLMAERSELSVVADQVGAPTDTGLIARASVAALRQCLESGAGWGLYHLNAAGETSWYGYAAEIARQAPSRGFALQCVPDAIRPIASRDWPASARRPANSRLDCSLFTSTFGLTLPDWRQRLAEVLDQLAESLHDAT
ncbi:dTDP-4-dehydrorhamnose reductase [Crenobacter cavernae]|uniref:dTDP-4-dehydrorhamnose reductase n=1 Tax=Crenobacter cavernae TaxID=2290923 RepID=A0A345Y289_9NEIS|nr:dTDP-4-dehydrorhamnose reductase [Crenobacter cavernae]AXK38041.1 dTDP-4-dehydrorhamnose reductase [Crenobacter cavernae]